MGENPGDRSADPAPPPGADQPEALPSLADLRARCDRPATTPSPAGSARSTAVPTAPNSTPRSPHRGRSDRHGGPAPRRSSSPPKAPRTTPRPRTPADARSRQASRPSETADLQQSTVRAGRNLTAADP